MKVFKAMNNQLKDLQFLVKARAPLWVIARFHVLHTSHQIANLQATNRYRKRKRDFRQVRDRLHLDNDWFTGNIPTWLRFFDSENLYARQAPHCLEIGSWQGLSAYFLLHELRHARLTCVDTWEGADEHRSGSSHTHKLISEIEQNFDSNLQPFRDRIDKYKGTSLSFFANRFRPLAYDLIYVDGSHHSDDVLVDAVKCFEMLKVGGILVFDDYFWRYYQHVIDNPAGAINVFLRLKHAQLRIIAFDYQLVIKKTAESARCAKRQGPARSAGSSVAVLHGQAAQAQPAGRPDTQPNAVDRPRGSTPRMR